MAAVDYICIKSVSECNNFIGSNKLKLLIVVA